MRLSWVGLGVGLALLASPVFAAPAEARPRTLIMWHPSDRLWAGALAAQGCGVRAIEPTGDLTLAAPIRGAVWERRGELIAELRSTKLLSLAALATARMCAARAADVATAPAMLTATVETWSTFQGALASCLHSEGAAKTVGSMTLWVDTSCNW